MFWALRGGGGNFGVATAFEFQLHPMQRQVIGGEILFPLDRARELLEFYADYSANAPDDVYADWALISPAGSADGFVMIDFASFFGQGGEQHEGPESGGPGDGDSGGRDGR